MSNKDLYNFLSIVRKIWKCNTKSPQIPTYLSLWSISEGSPYKMITWEKNRTIFKILLSRKCKLYKDRKCTLHYQVWLQHLQKLSEYYVQILLQKCYFLTQILLHWENQTAALYSPREEAFKEKFRLSISIKQI